MHTEYPVDSANTLAADNYVIELTEANIKQVIEGSSTTPVVIHFWAQMIDESTTIIPELKSLAQQAGGAFTLALLNCEQEQMIAGQFGIQTLPTLAVFVNGQPVDGLGGPQPIEAIREMLSKHLPSQDEMTLKSALAQLEFGDHNSALVQLESLANPLKERGDVKLARADCLIATQQFELAEQLLNAIPLEYQATDYKRLMAALELHQQAANSPELLSLEAKLTESPDDITLANELALQYQQVNRSEDALTLLWPYLQADLNALDGRLKKSFMDILAVLGQGSSIASKYRRLLYSLLY